MDNYVVATVLVVLGTAAGVLGLLTVRRWLGAGMLAQSHDVAGSLLSVVGTLYAVLLGLVVVDSLEDFEEAREATIQEENALVNLVLLSRRLPEAKGEEIRRLASSYARLVVEREWAAMDEGRTDPEAHRAALALVRAVLDFEPVGEGEKAVYPAGIDAAMQLWNSRHARAVGCATGIPPLEWAVLILGGVVTVAFTYFFVVDNLRLQVVMTALVALSISLNVVLVMMFGYPYSGGVRIAPPKSFLVPTDLMQEASQARGPATDRPGRSVAAPARPEAP
jgi:hypothetical protein